jgi:class 3 adenylate cyclase
MPQPSVFASVAFLKIHDFGRRPVVEQTRLRAQLEAVVAVTLDDLQEENRAVLDAADGIALVVAGNPQGTLRAAARALAAGKAGLPLAIGISHGAVRQTGKGKNEGLMGDGIAVAAAIAEVAGPQKLLLTKDFRDALADARPGAEAELAGAGTHTDASLRSHELYKHDARAPVRRGRRYLAATALAVLALIGAGLAYRASYEDLGAYAWRLRTGAVDTLERLRAEPPRYTPPPPAARKRTR